MLLYVLQNVLGRKKQKSHFGPRKISNFVKIWKIENTSKFQTPFTNDFSGLYSYFGGTYKEKRY